MLSKISFLLGQNSSFARDGKSGKNQSMEMENTEK